MANQRINLSVSRNFAASVERYRQRRGLRSLSQAIVELASLKMLETGDLGQGVKTMETWGGPGRKVRK